MAENDGGDKTEAPTPRRRQEAREQGQVPRSQDLTAAIVLLTGLALLNALGPQIFEGLLALTHDIAAPSEQTGPAMLIWIKRAGRITLSIIAPFLILLLVIGLCGAVAQTGPLLTWKKLEPKLDHINPQKGLKRIFSLDSLTRTGFGLLKMVFVAGVAYYSVLGQLDPILGTAAVDSYGIFFLASQVVFQLALRMALILLLLGLLDYLYQRWRLEEQLKMTKQEVRDEMKRMDGDPLLKSRRRQAQMKLAMQRLQTEVPTADVIVTNPTEYAVALKYDEATMRAPRMVAKGVDLIAARIRQLAHQHGIPIVQRPPLARALFAAAEVGDEVPPMYYKAVAEVLAYVYQLTRKAAS